MPMIILRLAVMVMITFSLATNTLGCAPSETPESRANEQASGEVVRIKPGDSRIDASHIKPCLVQYGTTTMMIRTTKLNDKTIFSIRQETPTEQGIFIDHVGLDSKSLEMVYKHAPYFVFGPAFLAAHLQGNVLTGSLSPIFGSEPPMNIATQFETPVFDEAVWGVILSALPLKAGFKAQLPRFSASRSDKSFSAHWVEVSVKKQETLQVDGKDYLCWIVNVDYLEIDYQEELWVTKQAPFLVKKKSSRGNEMRAKEVTAIDCCL